MYWTSIGVPSGWRRRYSRRALRWDSRWRTSAKVWILKKNWLLKLDPSMCSADRFFDRQSVTMPLTSRPTSMKASMVSAKIFAKSTAVPFF